MRLGLGTEEQERQFLAKATTVFANVVDTIGGRGIEEVIDSLLKSIVIQTWTAFERLAGDLLRFSVSMNAGHFPSINAADFRFYKRELMRESYLKVFPATLTDIHNPLNDLSIDALCLLRNLFAHSGGLVDKKFRDGCTEVGLIAWAALSDGHPLAIDGEIVEQHVNRMLLASVRLILGVNAHLP